MYRIGIDIGGTNIKIGFVDAFGVIFARASIPFGKKGYEVICAEIADKVNELAVEAGIDITDAIALGVAVPGSVNVSEGVVLSAYNLDFFNVPLKAELSVHFPETPIHIANDANAATLAELQAGALVRRKTAVMITIGTGTGGGLVLGGRMFDGGNGNGVELGHMMLVNGGSSCSCGNNGCVEAYCSAPWLEKKGLEVFGKADAKFVIDEAKAGNAEAVEIFDEFTDNLSTAVASICSLLDPETIAIGGGIGECGDILYDALKRKVKEKNFFKVDYEIVPAVLGNDAGIIGAAMLDINYI